MRQLGRTTSYTDAHGNTTTSTYDTQGHLTSRSGPLGNEEFIYDTYDRLTDQKLDTVTYAHVTYDTYSRIDNVTYPAAGQQKVTYARDTLGRLSSLTYLKGDGTTGPTDTVTRSVTGDILSGTENGLSKSYTYDNAGRLTNATIGSNTYAYSYAAPTSGQCAQPSANLNAHKNSNRTSMTVNGSTTTYCYNQADQLISSSDAKLDAPQYDDHGNTTQLGTTTTPIRFAYDASDRNTAIVQRDDTGTGFASYYTRDTQGRIIYREKDTISNWNWTVTNQTWYGFTGSGDTPDFTRDAAWNISEKYLQLPGNVLLTIRPSDPTPANQKTYSLPNIHGDIFATTDATGTLTNTTVTGPFGEEISGRINPDNTTTGTTFGYVGQHEKLTETEFAVDLTQMGVRVYVAVLGRFLQVDSVEGGGDNSYGYPVDSVNDFDLDGNMWSKRDIARASRRAASVGWNFSQDVALGIMPGGTSYANAYGGINKASGLGTFDQGYRQARGQWNSMVATAVPVGGVGGFFAKNAVKVSVRRAAANHWWPNPKGIGGRGWYKHVEINIKVVNRASQKTVKFIHKQIKYGKAYRLRHGKGGYL